MTHRLEPLLTVLGDETTLEILTRLADRPTSAQALDETLNVSLKTLYRRLDLLEEAGIVLSQPRIDERGNHYTSYESAVDEVQVTLKPDNSEIEVVLDQGDEVDRFIGLWTELLDNERALE